MAHITRLDTYYRWPLFQQKQSFKWVFLMILLSLMTTSVNFSDTCVVIGDSVVMVILL